jgi:uncharacterized protein
MLMIARISALLCLAAVLVAAPSLADDANPSGAQEKTPNAADTLSETLSAGFIAIQRSLMYQPTSQRTIPIDAGLPQAREVILNTSDAERLIAWYIPPLQQKPIIIFFHGTADSLASRASRFRDLTASGIGLLALSYRGYAGSTGHPSEEGLHRDAIAAYDFVAARFPPNRIVLWGFSLGSGVAVALAAKRPIAKLVLEAPYTSTADVAAAILPFVPVNSLMKDQFHSDERIHFVHAPILILHGERDPVIPIALGERLFALASAPKKLIRYPQGQHEDLEKYGAVTAALRFIQGKDQISP